MNQKEAILASDMLNQLSEILGSRSCNDWFFPDDWTALEKAAFVKEFHNYNGDPENFNPLLLNLQDFSVAGFLAFKLNQTS